MSRFLLWLFCLSLIAGCGQSGDLYLPDEAPEPVSEPAADGADAPESNEEGAGKAAEEEKDAAADDNG